MIYDETQPSWPHRHKFFWLSTDGPVGAYIHLSEKLCYCWDDPDAYDQCCCEDCIGMYRDWDKERKFYRIAKAKPIGTVRVKK